ncbi:type I restriction endonuclease subunit R [Ancylomarina sp. 16SWW S1-10-2]|uniref:type I restriction enzyme subunit R domain-containing protein n=1 Tax=Ancylomarina sp. 16SWW S1-10-2 TaxID=2499681 RepID=UPI0012AEAD5A|nr:type I restriction endonuclease subunit R [Ancylomarina sp. 16SWW S1-10-2]MRT91907.1 type I restriction endonuclease subunit R [Ancylomarina sp. 16SWW S1-10-2]
MFGLGAEGFDAQCVSTVYLDKPIKGHTLMQTIARANRVYDDEKENGLIVDYGNVYKQLEKAYSVYGEGGRGNGGSGGKTKPGKPVEKLIELELELKKAIQETKQYLKSLKFDLTELIEAKPMAKIGKLKDAADCVCLNDKTRATFEIMARNVFRKYKALFPEAEVRAYIKRHNAIEAIYSLINQKVKTADVTEIMMELQSIVSDSVSLKKIEASEKEEVYIDLGSLDFDKLKAAFSKIARKNTVVYDLKQAINQKLQQMLKENPLRIDFYERYKKIIEEYNRGKSLEDTLKAFDKLNEFIQDLSIEEQRAVRENLNGQEALAIFDLLKEGKKLEPKELKAVKKIAIETLEKLQTEKLKIDKWREKREIKAQVKNIIHDTLLYLPMTSYSDEEVESKSTSIYQHIYSNYYGGGKSVYQRQNILI